MILLNIITHPHKEYEGSVRLGAAHSLIIGHGPRLKLLEEEASNRRGDLQKFGLWEVSTPNYNTYYPQATPEDLNPKEDEFIRPLYRALSETVVRKKFDPIDFSKNGVLKASMGMLIGQTIYTNHDSFIGNEVGVVSKTFWATATEVNGVVIPAGINAEFMIDGKAHPNLARKINMDPPAVHSNSVTVNFKWVPSHPKMDYSEFRSKVGTYDDKGELIRRVVSEIKAYYETSLVSHGADPFAQKIGKDGNIVNPDLAIRRDSFSAEKEGASSFHFFSYKESLSEITIPVQLDNNNKEETQSKTKTMEKELVALLALLSGYELAEGHENLSQEEFDAQLDQEAFLAHIRENKEKLEGLIGFESQVSSLTADKDALTQEIEPLREFKTQNEKIAEQFNAVKADLRGEVGRLYSLAHGKEANEALNTTFDNASYETLKAFKESYESSVEDKFEMVCQDCQSHNVTRASSDPTSEEEAESGKTQNKKTQTKSDDNQMYYRIRRKGLNRKN